MKGWGWLLIGFILGGALVGVLAWRSIVNRQAKLDQAYAVDSIKSQAALIDRTRLQAERDTLSAAYLKLSVYAQASDARVRLTTAQLAATKPLRQALDAALAVATTTGDSVAALKGIVRQADAQIATQAAVIVSQSDLLDLRAQQMASLTSQLRLSDSTAASWKGEAERWRANADSARRMPTPQGKRWLGFLPVPTCVAGLGVVAGASVAAGTGIHTGLGGTAGVGILCGVRLGR